MYTCHMTQITMYKVNTFIISIRHVLKHVLGALLVAQCRPQPVPFSSQ